MKIEWTSYRFDPPSTLSEEMFLAARLHPTAFKQQLVSLHLKGGFKHIALQTLLFWGLGTGLVGIAYWLEFKEGDWYRRLAEGLAIGGMAIIASGVYTAGSYLKYAVNFQQFWWRVVVTAGQSES